MTLEYSRIFLKVILASKQPSKVNFRTSKLIFECFKSIFWTSMPPMYQNYSIFWTSMPPMHQNYSILLDLNASNASELFHILDLGGRRRRRRRRFPKNSGIWAEPWTNVPRNKISRAGNPSLRWMWGPSSGKQGYNIGNCQIGVDIQRGRACLASSFWATCSSYSPIRCKCFKSVYKPHMTQDQLQGGAKFQLMCAVECCRLWGELKLKGHVDPDISAVAIQ